MWLGCSGCDLRVAEKRPSPSSTSRRRLRYSERNRLRRMVNSQADMLVPGANESILLSARRSVSCTRSSARSSLPQSDMAKARNPGTAASMASRTLGSAFIPAVLASRLVELTQEGDEALGCRLDQAGIIGPQLLADLGLNVRTKTGGGFSSFGAGRFCRLPRRRWLAVPHFAPLPRTRPRPRPALIPASGRGYHQGLNARLLKWFRGNGTFFE